MVLSFQSGLSFFDLPGDRLWDGLRADGNLDTLLPLLPPRVGEDVVVLGVQLVRVMHLHGGDQVRPENLQQSQQESAHFNPSAVATVFATFLLVEENSLRNGFVFVALQFAAVGGSGEGSSCCF